MTTDKSPILVSDIVWTKEEYNQKSIIRGWKEPGLVKIRPCGKKYENKTFIGFYIGDAARSISTKHNKETNELEVGFCLFNPAIFVPELGEVIFGDSSWWSSIKSSDELQDITDDDINKVWYIQLLKNMGKSEVDNEPNKV